VRRQDEVRFEGMNCSLVIRRPAPSVVLVVIEGTDTGELGEAPFRELAADVAGPGRIELFVDARATRAASMHVSKDWALWLAGNRDRMQHISMLTASRFVQLTADFVRSFAELGPLMRIYSDPAAFEGALSNAVGNALAPRGDR
jgi:hypothetical protein